MPGIVADAGEHAARRFLEFFAATIRNRYTRMAYMTAVGRFFAWCEQNQIGQLGDIEPLPVGFASFTIALFCLGFAISPIWTATMDIAPDYAGSASALMNAAGAVPGILSPLAFGWILDWSGD